MVDGVKNLTGRSIPIQQATLLIGQLWEGARNASWVHIPHLSKEGTEVAGHHCFRLVLVSYPIPLTVLKNLISVSPPSNYGGAMEKFSISIPKL